MISHIYITCVLTKNGTAWRIIIRNSMICEEIVYAKEGKTEDEILKHRYLGNAKESK